MEHVLHIIVLLHTFYQLKYIFSLFFLSLLAMLIFSSGIILYTSLFQSREAAYLIDSITRYADRIHWARLQEGAVTYGRKAGILLAGELAPLKV